MFDPPNKPNPIKFPRNSCKFLRVQKTERQIHKILIIIQNVKKLILGFESLTKHRNIK